MNQSILFPDIQHWNEKLHVIEFPAQQGGALISCQISIQQLIQYSGQAINSPEQALAVFDTVRFDLEELAEALIEEEAFNQYGNVEVIS
ncbi:DUF1488 domain-containing protein [Vibrio cincinnatiensis]|jgi:hypothetical protein|uniref:Uncharacterized protein n=1 Tax=Vibrio cincinnatiensis DSM 19608 TaxID=1123491 RepID=A0A1T4SA81_VIBCI|nr:DUF1488 domain-containing protein [Vibrio cincinnatiensis]MCG3723673.1 DUF1488 domain-containing protein [Vibrio cincinnatiensis]MCG3726683.1 DUF1488 domain-containing protein [Vibrio cincinnatiensis]MCG3733833.1 DUF1488 domain-containing protein [Vibrio cincinnatiensis]MCG3741017.1 DUF1488 domain-containing protein [Vibrio cincinnatiensis]MCG3744475.1 DUF1488 domain-containing protein [Vibrio cincinnatiensis]